MAGDISIAAGFYFKWDSKMFHSLNSHSTVTTFLNIFFLYKSLTMRNFLFFVCFATIVASHFFNNAYAQDIREVLNQRFEKYQSSAPQERVFIINDRDIYAPGEYIWLSAAIYDVLATKMATQSNKVKVRLLNSELNEILYKEIPVNDGFGDGFVILPNKLSDGLYYLTGNTDKSGRESYYRQKIIIRNKIVPPFVIEASFPDRRFLPGEEIAFNILFKDHYNEPLKNIPYQLNLYDGKQMIQSISGKQKKDGETVMVKVPENLKSGMMSYKIVVDNKGKKVENMGVIPLLTNKIFVDFYPENGSLTDELPTRVNCFVYDACSVPIQVEADIVSENGVVSAISMDANGFASFDLTPEFGKKYYLQIKKPVLVETGYTLPNVLKEGFTLSIVKKEGNTIHCRIRNGHMGERLVFLVGISENEIFSFTELKFAGETTATIDISNAHGATGYFILVNSEANIEAEHIAILKPTDTTPLSLRVSEGIARPRSKVEIDVSAPVEPGRLVFTAVNSAWKADQLRNQPISLLSLPFDIFHTPIMQHILEQGDVDIEKYLATYEPRLFGWDKILNTDGTFQRHDLPEKFIMNRIVYDEISAQGLVTRSAGMIYISNVLSSSGFAAANPKYIYELHKIQTKSIPSYKTMLENGTPIMEVVKIIKPYNMYGNKIVFQGGANSLMAQDGALIIIDGINRGSDAAILSSLNPHDIENINISTNPSDIQRYSGLNSVGIIEIETKRGEELIEQVQEVISDNQQFESPDYEMKKDSKSIDWRSTLYWKIEKKEGDGRTIGFRYFNTDLITNVVGDVLFIPFSGPPKSAKFKYEIK
jgi:hypothetical protein